MWVIENLREETVLSTTRDPPYFLYINLETKVQQYIKYVSCFKKSFSTSYKTGNKLRVHVYKASLLFASGIGKASLKFTSNEGRKVPGMPTINECIWWKKINETFIFHSKTKLYIGKEKVVVETRMSGAGGRNLELKLKN